VPIDWVATVFTAQNTQAVAAYIQIGDLVRVVRGHDLHRQGVVVERLNHGNVLSLKEQHGKANVSV
jgi:hypothetical protein